MIGILLTLSLFLQHGGCMNTKQLEISAGHVFILNCSLFHEDEVVSVNMEQDWDAGIKVIDKALWFLPAQESHSGNYSCYYSNIDGPSEIHFSISVAKHECPPVPKPVYLKKSSNQHLDCDSEVRRNISIVSWTWMKDCRPLRNANSQKIKFHPVLEEHKGVYTCIMNFTLNGTSYTFAKSIQAMLFEPGPVPQKPRVIKPRQETLAVKLGSKQVLNCKVFVGLGSCQKDRVEISPYWLLNGSFVETNPYLSFVENCTTENNMEYRHSNLSISKVQKEFFNIPFKCIFHGSYGHDSGTIILIPAGESELYVPLAVFTAFALVALGVLLVLYKFKVDLVLAYRSLSPCLKQQNDGKLYDAYVSYLYADDHRVSFGTTFALHVLPEVLEDRFGYKLFISDRDTDPGTAIPDAISETVEKSRRLIIVLTPEAFTKTSENKVRLLQNMPPEHLSLNNNITTSQLNWGPYECWVGLYDALVKECLQVILVQVGGDVDEALLPESLRYIKQTQGILKWKQHYTINPNERFWKQLRYRMPPVPKARRGFMV
ncbi:interleukin-1 receptor type 1 [Tachysurus fulvidraco]|uniref:interleukin-1 receptor type 1 n=1 Tax=Tachysurus fulvidraco TaxID=1234273 RepID=UPI000F50930C|nr:interleukin-1 receptor type 1 [Tachysurus fulvidraco]XP_027008232.1 interleukin-1 receptor type 1 [Tachysurus fulvidraco]XP_047670691.1 interleukin-1 receptor type 1 [Tachysurus fulvidraco]